MSVSKTVLKNICASRPCNNVNNDTNIYTNRYKKTFEISNNIDINDYETKISEVDMQNSSLLLALNSLRLNHSIYNDMSKEETIKYYNEKSKLQNSLDTSLALKIMLNYKLGNFETENNVSFRINNNKINTNYQENQINQINQINKNNNKNNKKKEIHEYKPTQEIKTEPISVLDKLLNNNNTQINNNIQTNIISTKVSENIVKNNIIEKKETNSYQKEIVSESNFKPSQNINIPLSLDLPDKKVKNTKVKEPIIDQTNFDIDNIIKNHKKIKRRNL